MSNLSTLFEKQTKLALARSQRELADASVRLAEIELRCANIISQHEPLASLIGKTDNANEYKNIRSKLEAVARHVVYATAFEK